MAQTTGVQLARIDEDNQLSQQQQQAISISVASQANTGRPPKPILPQLDLINGTRENYLNVGIPLYEASIKCDWKAAKAILVDKPELVRYSITENGETALHVAASAKGPKHVDEFVKNLVNMMKEVDLELQNKNHNTALYLAAAAGNVKAVKIMVEKNSGLLTMAGSKGTMMPLYAAALFGYYDVVKYLYDNSKELCDDGWTPENRGWLLLKCVENDMFDIALQIVKKYPELGTTTGNVLGVLARKPEALPETESNIIKRTINSALIYIGCGSVFGALDRKRESFSETKPGIVRITINWVFAVIICSKVVASEKERNALQLLKFIWEDIAKKPKSEIGIILRGPADPIKHDKSASGRVIQARQLENLISEHITKMKSETQKIIGRQQDTQQPAASVKIDQVQLLQQLISKHLVNMHVEIQNIIRGPVDLTKQDNKTVSSKGDQALELQKLISEYIVNMHVGEHNIIRGQSASKKEDLQELITKHITKLHDETQKIIIKGPSVTYSNRILFVAAEMGNTNFLVELIRRYPDLIWKVNDNNQTIFHIAIKHRHEGIYNLLYEIGAMKDLITPLRDGHENNMLHLVGKSAKKKKLEDVSGVALQMQRELLWFKEVEAMIPPSYRDRKNEDDLTPHELFTKEHKELVSHGEKWMKVTASQCMVVAALIATIVFAAAFTVPGGYDQNSGRNMGNPVFDSKATFMVFVVADAISLFSSSASILMFLSILTSRYAERDFLESLPKKLMLGLATLFLSITTMTVAFSVSFFVLYHKGLLWMPILIGCFGVMPVLLYIKLQYTLFVDVIRSTYGSRYLFKPKKHVLYYKNPMF